MQKGGGCKTDWRWEGKCSSPGGCCKGGRRKSRRRKSRRRKSRRKKGRGSLKASPKKHTTMRKKHKTLKKKTKRPPSDGGNGLKIIEKYKRTPVAAGNPTTITRAGRPPSGRTVSTVSGTSVNTTWSDPLAAARGSAPADPRHQLQAIIGAGGQGQTDDEYRRRIAALLAADGGTAPRIMADESYPDLFDYHQATVGGELSPAFGAPRANPVTFSEVLMEPKLRKWEKDVQQEEAKKQWKKDLNLGPIVPPKSVVRREQYGGKRRRTRRRKRKRRRRRYGGNNHLQIDDDFVKYHDFLNKRLPEGLLAPRWKPGELASHTVISPDSNRTTIKMKRLPPPPPLKARREAQALSDATIPIGDFEGNHLDLDLSAGKKAAKKAARRQRLKRWAAENAAAAKKKKKTSRRQFSPQEKRLIAAGAPEGGRRRRRRTRRRKRRGGEFANNVRGHNVSKFNRDLAEKEFGPAKEPIKRDMITLERKKKYDEHIASLKPKDWRNMWGLFGGGRRRTRKQRRSRRGSGNLENIEAAAAAEDQGGAKRKEKEKRKKAYEKAAEAAAAAAAAPSNSAGNHTRAAKEDKLRRIKTLVEMGISEHAATAAVKRTSTMEGAVEWLTEEGILLPSS